MEPTSSTAADDEALVDLARQKAASRRRDWEDVATGKRTAQEVQLENSRWVLGDPRAAVILNEYAAYEAL